MTGNKIFLDSNDVWIAATVKQYGLTLISRDRHFAEIDNIPVEHW
jgi:tRNA(fMet)-specific endonuclease VapC